MPQPIRFVDLFAGCGGLSLGLQSAGLEPVLAVEKSEMAAESYFHNFIKRLSTTTEWRSFLELPIELQADRGLVVSQLAAVLDSSSIIRDCTGVDLVVGGPPCQGFSMAGRRDPADARNELPWQFLKFVDLTSPRAVIIENVEGIHRKFVKHGQPAVLNQLRRAFSELKVEYSVNAMLLNASHYGVPQHRPRMLMIALRRDVAARAGIVASDEIWRSDGNESSRFAPEPPLEFRNRPRTTDEAFWDLGEDGDYAAECNKGRYLRSEGVFAHLMRCDPKRAPVAHSESRQPEHAPNSSLRRHSDRVVQRFRLYQYLQAIDVSSAILTAECSHERYKRAVSKLSDETVWPARSANGEVIATDLPSLLRLAASLRTRKHSQRPLISNKPAPTVMTLPDDFVHYRFARTLSVREMARLQSFPDSFEFRAKETTGSDRRRYEVPQYSQVGNAVPPLLAEAVGRKLLTLLS